MDKYSKKNGHEHDAIVVYGGIIYIYNFIF